MNAERGISHSAPDLRGNAVAYLARCGADNCVSSSGPCVVEMGTQLARLTRRAYGVATVNGTAILHLALVSAGSSGSGSYRDCPFWSEGFVTLTAIVRRSPAGCHGGMGIPWSL